MRIPSPKRRLGVLVAVGALSWQATAAAQENFVVE